MPKYDFSPLEERLKKAEERKLFTKMFDWYLCLGYFHNNFHLQWTKVAGLSGRLFTHSGNLETAASLEELDTKLKVAGYNLPKLPLEDWTEAAPK